MTEVKFGFESVAHQVECQPLPSTSRTSLSASRGHTVCTSRSLNISPLRTRAATEEFDQLCFEFGIELDEDVRSQLVSNFCTTESVHRPPKTWKRQSRTASLLNVLQVFVHQFPYALFNASHVTQQLKIEVPANRYTTMPTRPRSGVY